MTEPKVLAMTLFKHTHKKNQSISWFYCQWKTFWILNTYKCIFYANLFRSHVSFLHTCFKYQETATCSVHPAVCSFSCKYTKYIQQCTGTIYYPFSYVNSIAPWEHKSKFFWSTMASDGIKIFITIKWNGWDVRCSFACLAFSGTLLNTYLASMIRWWQGFTHWQWHQ